MNFRLNAYAIQDIGQRTNQEDCFYPPFLDPCHYDATSRDWSFYDGTPHTDDRLFIVCDGMGGHDRGEVASQTVTRIMSQRILQSAPYEGFFNDDMLRHAVDESLSALIAQDDPNEKLKMGTTMTMLKFHAQGATVAHIGDSRVYHFRPASSGNPARILFRTNDHTVANDLFHHGQMTYAQTLTSSKRHILSRAMTSSCEHHPEVDIQHITDIQAGDIFLLCTDGIYENLDDDQLLALLTDPNHGDLQRIQMILHACLNNRDNHSAYIVRVEGVLNTSDKKNTELPLTPGTVLKSEKYTYHIEKALGNGAFGITYLVNTSISMEGQLGTIHTGVKMALKEFCMEKDMKRVGSDLVELSPDSKVKTYADKFRHEALKLASLSHPNIVKVLEVFEANNTIYYSMEYLPSGSLNDYVNKKGGISEQEAIAYIRQIGSALLYMHTNKLLHLDVKPANIMRCEGSNTVKIIDFGLAKRFAKNGDPESSANLGFGTPGYAPLEQVDASIEHAFSPSLDVYALGATYYKLLTSLVPNSAIEVLNRGLNTLPLVKKKVSQKSIDAIKAAMEPMQAKRLKTVDDFLDMLPRVDDEAIFPKKKEYTLWQKITAISIACIAVLGIAAWMVLHNMKTDDTIAGSTATIDIKMVNVPGGTFLMGCPDTDPEVDEDERPVRHITVSSFKMSAYEVTVAEWRAIMDEEAGKSKNDNFPITGISWDDAQTFIKRLNKITGRNFRLPTEAEWEYAARGGNKAEEYAYSGATELDSVAWYNTNSGDRIHPVGRLKPNALGLYDMSGNAWELCSDWYGEYTGDSLTNPTGANTGDYHVIRGGSWNSSCHSCRVTFRQDDSATEALSSIGLRLVE